MREKILARLKAKYSGVNLSKKRLDAIADKLEKKITEESEIDAELDDLNDIWSFADMAKQDDRLRTLESKEKGKKKQDPDPDDDDDVDEPTDPKAKGKKKASDEPPAWAKGLIDEIASLKKEKTQKSMMERIAEKLKGPDGKPKVPAKFYAKLALPENEDELDDFVAGIETDYTEMKQEMINSGVVSGAPAGGGGTGAVKSTTVDKDIEDWASKESKTDTTKK